MAFTMPAGARQLTDPSQISQYKILGQYGQTGAPGSFLYGTPKKQQADSRQLPAIQSQPVNAPIIEVQQQGQTFDRNKILQDTIAAMLKAAQGAGDEDLVAKRNAIIQARFNAQRQATPEELRVLAPSQQASLRGLDVGGLEEQLGGVQTALTGREKKRSAQIEAAQTLFNVLMKQQELEEKAPTVVGGAATGYKQYKPGTKTWEEIIKPESQLETPIVPSTSPEINKIKQQILASKGLTKQQRTDVSNLIDSQGIDGLKQWAYYNRLSTEQQQIYGQYESAYSMFDFLLDGLQKSNQSTGPYKAIFNKAKPWLAMKKDQQYVDLMAQIEQGQAQLRRGFFGTAITPTEAVNANRFLVNDNDDIQTIKTKLQGASQFLKFVNDATVARSIGIEKPKLNDYISNEQKKQTSNDDFSW